MHFSLFGKQILVTIPHNVAPVESGHGVIWEDVSLSSKSTISLPSNSKSFYSSAESVITSAYKTFFRPHLTFKRSRTIVVESPAAEAEVVVDPVLDEAASDVSFPPSGTESTAQPADSCSQETIVEDTHHTNLMKTPEERVEYGSHQTPSEESL